MIDRRFLVITATILHIVAVSSVTDHLVPPPLPPAGAPPQQIQPSSRGGPVVRPQGGFYPNAYAPGTTSEPPGFMQRIARWFGFNDEASRQASQNYLQYKESPRGHPQAGRKAPCGLCNKYPWHPMFPGQIQYPLSKVYQSPQGNEIHQSQWNQHQEQLRQQQYQQQPQPNPPQLTRQQQEQLAGYNYPQHQQQLPVYPPLNGAESQYAPSQFQPPLLQRAVQFSHQPSQDFRPPPPPKHAGNPPPPYKPQPHFAPIPVPQLSPSAVPPVYDAEPFRPLPQQPAKLDPTQFQQLPKFEPTLHFQDQSSSTQFNQQPTQSFEGPPQFQQIADNAHPSTIENIGASSEIRNSYPSAQPPNSYQEQQQSQQSLNSYQKQQQNQQSLNSYQEQQQTQQSPNSYQEQQQSQLSPNSYQEQLHSQQSTSNYQEQQQSQQSTSSYQEQQQSQQSPITPSFEIIKSHQVTNFVSEIEYPANYVQSQTIDVPQDVRTSTLTPEEDRPVTLTELGSYSEQYTVTPAEESHSAQPEEQYAGTDSAIYSNTQETEAYGAPDNYPSASSHNLSVQHENHLDIDPIQHSSSENYLPQSEVYVPTPAPTTVQPQFVTDDSQQTTVEIVPSLQTTYTQRLNYKRDRETPKRLLDSPIHYFIGGSSPRPFTRDPSELQIRSSTPAPQIQNQRETGPPAPTPWHMAPTPTSTYTSIDASGHYAGMNPPQPKQYHQIIIPYTTKHKPRPFQPKEQAGRYDNWTTSSELDQHEQQESKLVTATQEPAQRTTKYLTKILASNIRELLKKEHEVKNKSKSGFDLSKLQKNIDDWTEQEFTSLSHRASTVSLRGPSKHIPTEYLTTTPSLREGKTTVFTPNHLEPLIFKDRGNKRYEYRQVDDNRIDAQAASSTTPVPSTSTTTTTTTPIPSTTTPIATTTTTTTEAPTTAPYYIRAISTTKPQKEDWNQAKVTVSPLTKEKLYVVTPQPVYSPASVGSFKSPRFIVRPTPASAGSNTTPRPSLYTPELFGLMGISAYIPAAPVETFDGHSKVITVVTPSPSIKASGEAAEAGVSSSADSTSETSNNDRRSS